MEHLAFQTALGYCALARQNDTILALTFGHGSQRAADQALRIRLANSTAGVEIVEPGTDELVDRLCAFAEGDRSDLSDTKIDTSHCTPFQRGVIRACRKIPWGKTTTYGQLANRVGCPGAARAVGSVMSSNRVPLIVPCHRVVPASGGLGGFSAPQGIRMKRRLLELEKCVTSSLLAGGSVK